jgi:ankyrin repeat protein
MNSRVLGLAMGLIVGLGLAPAAAGPLHEAARTGRVQTVERLIDQGADVAARDGGGETALTTAALFGQRRVVEVLLDRGAAVDERNRGGFTALHAAAFGGHLAVVRLLLDRGASVNDQENDALKTVLHMAAEENYLDIAALLLAKGADIEAKDLNHHTPASKAAFRLHEDMVLLLRRRGAGCQPITVVGPKYHGYCLARCG